MSGAGDAPSVEIPLETWRQIVRRVRQLEQMHRQGEIIVESLVTTIDQAPADEAGNRDG